jgi:hypothetical protein
MPNNPNLKYDFMSTIMGDYDLYQMPPRAYALYSRTFSDEFVNPITEVSDETPRSRITLK